MQPQQQPIEPPRQEAPIPGAPPQTLPPPVPEFGSSPPANPAPTAYPAAPPELHPNYDFIMNAEHNNKTASTDGSRSMVNRVLVVLIGLVILVVLFAVIKGLLAGNPAVDITGMTVVVEDQAEIIHLLNNTSQVPTAKALLTVSNQDFIVTGKLSIGSQESQLEAYLKANGHNPSQGEINLKESSRIDKELTASVTASDYDQTFTSIMQAQMANYKQDLGTAYENTKEVKGRALLKSDYAGAVLLLEQINSPES
jgi:hypothetical protein